jgi:hypothetical protein
VLGALSLPAAISMIGLDLVGLHPDFVREIAGKGGYLASEEAHWVSVPRTRRAKPGVAVTALEVADA